jgi:hypothetical protein
MKIREMCPTLLFWVLFMKCLSANALSFESLKQIILEQKIDSIEALIPLLPDSLRSKFVLVFKSRSLQTASYQDPRAILFGDDATFILSFNGSADQRGFDDLEMAEFDNQKKQFIYHEILFPSPSKNRKAFTFSESNPEKCQKCHGNPARPIWDTHPLWPGAYGQVYHAPLAKTEAAGLAGFMLNQPKHPRYRALLHLETFTDPATFSPTTVTRYEGSDRKLPPNAAFGQLLSQLNLQTIARQATNAKAFPQFQYVLLASLNENCGSIESYFPEGNRAEVSQRLRQFAKLSNVRNTQAQQLKLVRLKDPYEASLSSEVVALDNFRFLSEIGLGLSTDDWTLALEKRTYDFTSSSSTIKLLEQAISQNVIKADAVLKRLDSLRAVSSDDRYCDELRRKSIKAILDLKNLNFDNPIVFTKIKNDPPVLLQKCIGCHHESSVARSFPFAIPKDLSRALEKGKFARGNLLQEILYRLSPLAGDESMPRGLNLSSDERKELEEYFKNYKHP